MRHVEVNRIVLLTCLRVAIERATERSDGERLLVMVELAGVYHTARPGSTEVLRDDNRGTPHGAGERPDGGHPGARGPRTRTRAGAGTHGNARGARREVPKTGTAPRLRAEDPLYEGEPQRAADRRGDGTCPRDVALWIRSSTCSVRGGKRTGHVVECVGLSASCAGPCAVTCKASQWQQCYQSHEKDTTKGQGTQCRASQH